MSFLGTFFKAMGESISLKWNNPECGIWVTDLIKESRKEIPRLA